MRDEPSSRSGAARDPGPVEIGTTHNVVGSGHSGNYVEGLLTAAALTPFFQAIATKFGTQAAEGMGKVWGDLMGRMRRDRAQATAPEVPAELLLEGPNGARVFFSIELPPEAVRHLVEMGAEGLRPLGENPTLRWHGNVWRANLRQDDGVIVGEKYWDSTARTWNDRPPSP
ncbi:hypothetical protein [Streptomyces sp. NPDC056672]|uniref:hypothetical protein n=1 Tax=Streptomyces sp. NPDC056672 TaxID=3345906 RepID=UPI0036933C3F